jgi:hypothetical protein
MKKKRSIGCMKNVIKIISIPSGQIRNYTGKEIVEKYSLIFYRKICNQYMIQQDGKDMKFGEECSDAKVPCLL